MLWRMWTWTTTFAVPTALATAMGCVSAQAQLWPQRPVHIIAPYAAGGNSDGIARIVAQRLTDAFGQTFVVENRLGANGAIATDAVARSPADGYTLLWGATPPLTINPALTKVNYDPIKDFAPISVVAVNAFVLVVNKNFPPKTIAEFIAHVRAQPNKLAYAEGSAGSLTHLTMALFLKRAGLSPRWRWRARVSRCTCWRRSPASTIVRAPLPPMPRPWKCWPSWALSTR
jgi:tripartite-type tricarboxylate transporter receptor subunit TctC